MLPIDSCISSTEIHGLVRSRWGNAPLDEAKTFGRVQIVEYLSKWAEERKVDEACEQLEASKTEEKQKKNKPETPSDDTSPLP